MAEKCETTKDAQKTPTDRAVDKVRSSWAAVKALAKKAKNHWQMRPGESRRDSQLPADNRKCLHLLSNPPNSCMIMPMSTVLIPLCSAQELGWNRS